jgi:hypothetical protein
MLCEEIIAETTLEELSYPMRGSMFRSPDKSHGIPDPWLAYEEWADMRCPYSRTHRPMVNDDVIRTDAGMVRLSKSNGKGARFDYETTQEINRESIIDRTIMIPDDEAELRARMELQKGMRFDGETKEGAGQQEDAKPVEVQKEKKRKRTGRR